MTSVLVFSLDLFRSLHLRDSTRTAASQPISISPRRRQLNPHPRDAEDGAVLVHRRHRLPQHRRGVAALSARRLELVRRHPLGRLILLPPPVRHRGRRPLRQRHRLRHLQCDVQGRAGAAGELPGRYQQLPLGEGAHVLWALPRHRHLLRLHRFHALPPRHGAHAAEVRYLLHAWLCSHHRVALRAERTRQPARPYDVKREAAIYSGVHRMHGWHNLCLYGASQLFSIGDILDPSGPRSCLLHYILLPWRL